MCQLQDLQKLVQAAESIEALESEHDALLLEALWQSPRALGRERGKGMDR